MNIAIIGGGASGMILAALINDKNMHTTLFEKNSKLGKKLLLTGNGKCNFTSGDFSDLNDIYNNDFARNLYKAYDCSKCLDFYKNIGVEPKVEIHKGIKYYYPSSNKATSVYYDLYDKIIDNGVNILYNISITDIEKVSDGFIVYANDRKYSFDRVIIATGGASYKSTGSDGTFNSIIKKLNHHIIDIIPGLTGYSLLDKDIGDLKGVRVDGKVYADIDKDICEVGEIQFTDFGISGIPIYNISRKINRRIANGEKVKLIIDFNISLDKLKSRIKCLSYKLSRDFLCGLLPDELGNLIIKRANIKADKNVPDLSDNDINSIYNKLSNLEFTIDTYQNFDKAQITLGGVDVLEVDNDTLESKKVKGLYFMGEVLDIDGKCGGYNLQLAFSCASAVYGGLLCSQN